MQGSFKPGDTVRFRVAGLGHSGGEHRAARGATAVCCIISFLLKYWIEDQEGNIIRTYDDLDLGPQFKLSRCVPVLLPAESEPVIMSITLFAGVPGARCRETVRAAKLTAQEAGIMHMGAMEG